MSHFQNPRAICILYSIDLHEETHRTPKKQSLSLIILKILFLLNIRSISSLLGSTLMKNQPVNTHVNVEVSFPVRGLSRNLSNFQKTDAPRKKTDARKKITPCYSLNIVEYRKINNKPRKIQFLANARAILLCHQLRHSGIT